jgi:formate C-acetyltransferase
MKTPAAEALNRRSRIRIPGLAEPLSLQLPDALAALRDKALILHARPRPGLPELVLADAAAWTTRAPGEEWQVWRARRCRERLRTMRLELEAGETIVGKPCFREPEPDEADALSAAQTALADVPPFPGGDPGHFHPDYEVLLDLGIGGMRDRIDAYLTQAADAETKTFYRACAIAWEGLADFVHRTAASCTDMVSTDPGHAAHWRDTAALIERISDAPPATFHEALQLLFLTEIALWFAEDHGLTCPGRIDRTLRRFYEADVASGVLTPQQAFHMICCLYVHMNRILWPGSAVAVMVGGQDAEGRDVTNTLTYLCLAAREATRLVYPTVGLAWQEHCPDELMEFCCEMIATGIGDPALFNDDLIAAGLCDRGVSRADCRNYMNSTCVEIKVVGASNMWVTQPYFNCPQALLDVLAQTDDEGAPEPATFAEFETLVQARLDTTIRQAAQRLDIVWKARETAGCFPLASCLIHDCLEKGRDFDRGGARYNWVENSFVGLANLVDSLLAVKHLVYDTGDLSLAELRNVLAADFDGHEALRQRIRNTVPSYGNDLEEADRLAKKWAEFLIASTESNTVGIDRYVPGFFCWIQHERLGSQTGATPDGRHGGTPLADGAGAAQGRESNGPTAAVLSSTKWSHRAALGGLVHNIKFSRSMLKTSTARQAMRAVLETYLRRGGFEIQVNVVGREVLLDAQKHPEMYPDLLVRVAGYSDYFVHLNRNMQNEVIARTEHQL